MTFKKTEHTVISEIHRCLVKEPEGNMTAQM